MHAAAADHTARGAGALWHGRGGPSAALRSAAGAEDRGPLAWRRESDAQWVATVDLDPLPEGTLLVPSLALRSRAPRAYVMRILLAAPNAAAQPAMRLAPISIDGDMDVLETLGHSDADPVSGPAGTLHQGLDCVETVTALHGARLEIRAVTEGAPPDVDLCVSHRPRRRPHESLDPAAEGGAVATTRHILELPSFSQMSAPPAIARSICSPTCIAMLLARHGLPMDTEAFAHAVRHPHHGIFGMWPSNLAAAHRYGFSGLVRCFADAREAVRLLDTGTPIVTSIRFGAGELPGAALPRTGGHLVVLRGLDAREAHINDPAAATEADVATRLPREAFLRAWLGDRGVGYVLWPLSVDGADAGAGEER